MIQIRVAEPEDDGRIGELLVESFVSTYAREMPEVVVTPSRIADLRNVAQKRQTACVLVAEDQASNKIIGTLTLFPPNSSASKAWLKNTAEIRYMALDPKWQGKGVSVELLDEAKQRATQWGSVAISLHVRRGAHGVARMYEKNGYVRSPEGDLDLLPEIYLEAYVLALPPSP